MIANITANAVRHTPAGSAVRLLAGEISDEQGRRVQIRVVDSGPGVPGGRPGGDVRAVPAARRRPAGRPASASGLAVARGLAEAVDATIEVEDTPGGGLTMIVTVPVAVAIGRRGCRAGRRGEMIRVLVVDDDRPLARALAINLKAHGYDVTVAHDGRAALTEVARAHPAVVVLDLGLPDLDGIEVLAGIRGWSAIPVIVLSARSTSAEKVEALDAGADDYVTKPFGMDELLARIRAAVRRAAPASVGRRRRRHHRRLHRGPRPPTGCCAGERAGPADSHRMVAAGIAGPARRQAGPAEAVAHRGLGAGIRARNPLPAGLSRAVAAEAGTRPGAPAVPDHRAGRRVPLRALRCAMALGDVVANDHATVRLARHRTSRRSPGPRCPNRRRNIEPGP